MKGLKISKLHCPVHKMKVKRSYYRLCLLLISATIWAVHHHAPDYEMHVVFLTNAMFALDPTA